MAQPQSQARTLVDEIEKLRASGLKDEFGLHRVEREARKLLDSDACDAYMILGMVACLRNDPAGMRENHNKSLPLAPGDDDPYYNFGTSLSMMGFSEEGADLMRDARGRFPGSSAVARVYASCLVELGRYDEVIALAQEGAVEADENDHEILEARRQLSEVMLPLCESKGLKPTDVGEAIGLVRRVLHANGYYFHHLFQEVVGDEAGEWLRVMPEIPGLDEQRLFDLEDSLVDAIVDAHLPAFDKGLVVARFL